MEKKETMGERKTMEKKENNGEKGNNGGEDGRGENLIRHDSSIDQIFPNAKLIQIQIMTRSYLLLWQPTDP